MVRKTEKIYNTEKQHTLLKALKNNTHHVDPRDKSSGCLQNGSVGKGLPVVHALCKVGSYAHVAARIG